MICVRVRRHVGLLVLGCLDMAANTCVRWFSAPEIHGDWKTAGNQSNTCVRRFSAPEIHGDCKTAGNQSNTCVLGSGILLEFTSLAESD